MSLSWNFVEFVNYHWNTLRMVDVDDAEIVEVFKGGQFKGGAVSNIWDQINKICRWSRYRLIKLNFTIVSNISQSNEVNVDYIIKLHFTIVRRLVNQTQFWRHFTVVFLLPSHIWTSRSLNTHKYIPESKDERIWWQLKLIE